MLRIGVDLDGVLGDQVTPVLGRASALAGSPIGYGDIVSWRYPLGSSDISTEIITAQRSDPAYLLDMPVHLGAREMMAALGGLGEVVVVTARPPEVVSQTREWLKRNHLRYDQLFVAEEARKSIHGCDVLVDDYVGNLVEFLTAARGFGVLIDQPWNRADRDALESWSEDGRCALAAHLANVFDLVERYCGARGFR